MSIYNIINASNVSNNTSDLIPLIINLVKKSEIYNHLREWQFNNWSTSGFQIPFEFREVLFDYLTKYCHDKKVDYNNSLINIINEIYGKLIDTRHHLKMTNSWDTNTFNKKLHANLAMTETILSKLEEDVKANEMTIKGGSLNNSLMMGSPNVLNIAFINSTLSPN